MIDVYDDNFFSELEEISKLIKTFNYIAMDTEYPGVATVPTGGSQNEDFYFKLMKENIDTCKII